VTVSSLPCVTLIVMANVEADVSTTGCDTTRMDGLRCRLRELRTACDQLEDLVHRGKTYERWFETRAERGVDVDALCSHAARVRTAAPVRFPLNEEGWPVEALPPGFSLPFPTLQGDLPESMLQLGARRAPPPVAEVTPLQGEAGGVWTVRLRPLPPASAVLYTTDGSLPRTANAAARRASGTDGPGVILKHGGMIISVAMGPGLIPSDAVTVKGPKGKSSNAQTPTVSAQSVNSPPPPVKQVSGAPKKTAASASQLDSSSAPKMAPQVDAKAKAKAQFRGLLMLGGSDSEDSDY